MKTHVFRLRRGSDLLKALQEYARTRRIAAGTVVSGVGCVTRARVRDASGVTVRELNEPLEIVSLMGTLSAARTHLHIALAREDLTVLGGPLMEGCIVNTTAEVVLLELYGVRFGAEWDGETGYDELAILSLEEQA